MNHQETPFDNIESALEYVTYLLAACQEAQQQVEAEIVVMSEPGLARKKKALELVRYKLERLTAHMSNSEHLLKDLRKLRRVILEERVKMAKA